jgi:AcrR family transcriptional regulator
MTKRRITHTAKQLFARGGYDAFSMRTLAHETGIQPSSIYNYFDSKDALLKYVFDITCRELGQKRKSKSWSPSATTMLRERIEFQFDNAEDILFVLRYYLHFRDTFPKQAVGYLDNRAYDHIKEVLEKGIQTGEFTITPTEVDEIAKVIAHSVNGFLLEYFPESPKKDEYNKVVDSIHRFMVARI